MGKSCKLLCISITELNLESGSVSSEYFLACHRELWEGVIRTGTLVHSLGSMDLSLWFSVLPMISLTTEMLRVNVPVPLTLLPHGLSARLRLVCKIMNYFWDNQIFQNKNAEWNKKKGFDKYLLQGMSVCDKFCFFTYITEVSLCVTFHTSITLVGVPHIYSVNTSFVNLLVGTVVAMSLIRSKNNWLEVCTNTYHCWVWYWLPASGLYWCPYRLFFPWQREVFYAKECGTEHEELCCKNQYRAVDNSLWRYRHSYSSENDCCREWCYTHILFHRHSFF